MQSTGQLIREHRKTAGLTQQQLAAEFGMSRATISLIESGAVNEIGIRKLSYVCAHLGLTIQVTPNRLPTLAEAHKANMAMCAADLAKTSRMVHEAFRPTRPRRAKRI